MSKKDLLDKFIGITDDMNNVSLDTGWLDGISIGTNESIDELLNKDKQIYDGMISKIASKMVNDKIEEIMKKIQNKERKILIDSPMKIEGDKKMDKCVCGCTEKVKNKSELNVANAFTADSLKKNTVKLINVNQTAEKILTGIYEDIKELKNAKQLEYDFMAEEFDDLLLNVRMVTIAKVLNRVMKHLQEHGFTVDLTVNYGTMEANEAFMTVSW